MTSAQDFAKLFNTELEPIKVTPELHVNEDIKTTLTSIKPVHEWVKTGELKPDGSPKCKQGDIAMSEDGRAKIELGFTLTDEDNIQTSTDAPFKVTGFFTFDEVKQLGDLIKKEIVFENLRLKIKSHSVTSKSGFTSLQSDLYFDFDGVRF